MDWEDECKRMLDAGKIMLEEKNDIDTHVFESYFWALSRYHRVRRDFTEFYINALQYLRHTSHEALPKPFKMEVAFDLCLSALLGENIYNFKALLSHPIMDDLLGTNVEWMHDVIMAFNSGDLARYRELCEIHTTEIRSQPVLAASEKKLLEKIRILCIMEIFLSREERTVTLIDIAEQLGVTVEVVEHLLVKCMSVKLLVGKIDQVQGTVTVSYVQPRVLRLPQVKKLKARISDWEGKVDDVVAFLDAEVLKA